MKRCAAYTQSYGLSDRVALAPARDGEEIDRTEISDMAAVERMVEGVDGIIHLGGNSGENTWDVILQSNIVGVYNVCLLYTSPSPRD